MKSHHPSDSSLAAPEAASRSLEVERSQFRQLLALNPNYFGNFPGSDLPVVKPIATNTSFEELACVGFDPAHDFLEATIHLKRPFGYKGNLCQDGSTEYVRFYVDYGSGWEDVGLASFNAHDIPNTEDCAGGSTKPLVYVVTHLLAPRRRCCRTPVLPLVRAILSWETPPPAGLPAWIPVWGNVRDRRIQIRPRSWTIGCLFEEIVDDLTIKPKIPKYFEELQEIPLPIPEPDPEPFAELAALYAAPKKAGDKAALKASEAKLLVEPHRFGLPVLQAAMAAGGADQFALASFAKQWAEVGLSWSEAFQALQQTKANVNYEELTCVGLDYNREWLVATIHIKRPAGYSGTLCRAGSYEHVAFWVDWEDKCEWTYVATVSVNVHDFPSFPDGGLHYAAILPVDLSKYRRACDQPRLSRVRAVLSWSTLPSTTDPDDLQTYGNRLDAHVQVRPGAPITGPLPHIRSLGGIPIEHIDTAGDGMTRMLGAVPAKFWFNDAPADAWGLNRDCAFGGQVLVHGMWFPGHKYRVLVKKETEPAAAAKPLLTSFDVTRWTLGSDTQNPDSVDPVNAGYGFFTYLNPALYLENNILGVWSTAGDERWEVKLQLATVGYAILGETPWLKLQLDNTAPQAEISIDNGGECKGFHVGDVITGTFVARDPAMGGPGEHFGAFGFTVFPASTSPNPVTTAWPSTSPTPLAGTGWTLNTAGMKPCGYAVQVLVSSRTIVGSQSGGHHHTPDDVGFYLLA